MTRCLFAMMLCWPGFGDAACRQALALGLDVSGSVDAVEYRLQLDGLAVALNSDDVRAILLAEPAAPIRIAVYEWSGPDAQSVIVPWTETSSPAALGLITRTLQDHQRSISDPTTAIGAAMETGFALLANQSDCWTRTLDLSGDGPANTGPRPQDIPVVGGGIVVNGLVIGPSNQGTGATSQVEDLSSYYASYVIRGTGAFVEVAHGFNDYAAAMERKLLRELQSLAIGQAPSQQASPTSR